MRRVIIILVVAIIAVGVGAFFLNQRRASQEQEFEIIREAEVALDQIAATVNATGTTEPEALVTLSFRAGFLSASTAGSREKQTQKDR